MGSPETALVRTLGGKVIYPSKPTRRFVLCACVAATACVVSLAGPAAASAEATGTIAGTVSEASAPQAGVGGVQVYAINPSGKIVRSVSTDGAGDYALTGLALGTYKVQFLPGSESKFVGQFYDAKLSLAEASSVALEQEGEVKLAIDAKLREGATFSGRVTDVQEPPLQGVRVAAMPISESEVFFGTFARTDANGEYTLKGLPQGSYSVEFAAPAPLNYAPQYFDGKPSLSKADPVEVIGETEAKANIDARLQAGGEISGVVTDAVTGRPLANVGVSAFDPSKPELFGFATTSESGEYTVLGLQSGSYTVEFEFFPETPGAGEYLAHTLAGIAVTQGSVTAAINVGLRPKTPHNVALPGISGTAGSPIAPPPASPVPGPAGPGPALALAGGRLVVSGGSVRVAIRCLVAPCTGSLTLLQQPPTKPRAGRTSRSHATALVLGRGSFSLHAAGRTTVLVRLTGAGKRALARAAHHRLSATLTAALFQGATVRHAVLITAPGAKHG